MDGSILLKNWAYGKRKMSIDTRQCTRKTSQLIDSNEENELVCVCDSQTQVIELVVILDTAELSQVNQRISQQLQASITVSATPDKT